VVQQRLHQQPRLRGAAAEHAELLARLRVAVAVEAIAHGRRAGVHQHDWREQLMRRHGRKPLDGLLLVLQLRDPRTEPSDFSSRIHSALLNVPVGQTFA
jgi:uncharacterized protein (DUF58 family)